MMKNVSTEEAKFRVPSLDLQKREDLPKQTLKKVESSEVIYEPNENVINVVKEVKKPNKPSLWWLVVIGGIGLFLHRRRG